MKVVSSFKDRTRRALRWGHDPEGETEAELKRLRAAPRHARLSSSLPGSRFELADGASFCAGYQEIFGRQIYAFTPASETPLIIDGGANVGLSVAYFKQAHPASRVIAFEADPYIFDLLQTNVRNAGLTGVQLINKALWHTETHLTFWNEGADAGRIARAADSAAAAANLRVPTARLRSFLQEQVDFLKLDIEGAEVDVLLDCADLLTNVRQLFVEYHSFEREEQRLDLMLGLLKQNGFRVYIQTVICPPQPLLTTRGYLGMDLQLNVFGRR